MKLWTRRKCSVIVCHNEYTKADRRNDRRKVEYREDKAEWGAVSLELRVVKVNSKSYPPVPIPITIIATANKPRAAWGFAIMEGSAEQVRSV